MADGPEFESCHHDNLNLPGAGCCEVISTLGLGPMESPKGLDMEFPGLSKKKKKTKNLAPVHPTPEHISRTLHHIINTKKNAAERVFETIPECFDHWDYYPTKSLRRWWRDLVT